MITIGLRRVQGYNAYYDFDVLFNYLVFGRKLRYASKCRLSKVLCDCNEKKGEHLLSAKSLNSIL